MYDYTRKAENLAMLNNRFLNKTLSMFEWGNLPVPKRELEKQLQKFGYSFI